MQTIGEQLEDARKRKGISLREASEATKIRGDYLQRFESNNFEIKLPDIYIRGFLRTYAQYLNLNHEKLILDFESLGLAAPRETARDQRETFGRIDIAAARQLVEEPATAPMRTTPQQPQRPTTPGQSALAAISRPAAENNWKPFALYGAVGLAVIFGLVALVKLLSSDSEPPRSPTLATPNAETLTLIAIDNVNVNVVQERDQRTLFDGDLVRGETRTIARTGRVQITYRPGKNLQVESRGTRLKMGVEGYGRSSID